MTIYSNKGGGGRCRWRVTIAWEHESGRRSTQKLRRNVSRRTETQIVSCTCTKTNRLPARPQHSVPQTETPKRGGSCPSAFRQCSSRTRGHPRVARSNPSCLSMRTRSLLPQQLTCLSQGHTRRQTTQPSALLSLPGDTIRLSVRLSVRVCVGGASFITSRGGRLHSNKNMSIIIIIWMCSFVF